jgi:naphthoate synthase/2-ketocyclohexanecarboxyl-CoA hydrolase
VGWSDWARVEGDGLDFAEIVYEKKTHSELEGGIARVSFNKPDKYNAMTLSTVDEMFRAFYDANHDTSIGAIVVAGNGKHFGVGGDVEWEKWGLREAFYNRYPHNRLIRISRKPVIAAVQGYCLGGHNHMAYCCDCRRYTAEQAREMGLVNEVVPLEQLGEAVDRWCEELLQVSPGCLEILKAAFDQEMDGYAEMGVISSQFYPDWFDQPEGKEGGAAFSQKRTPRFWSLRARERQMREQLVRDYEDES